MGVLIYPLYRHHEVNIADVVAVQIPVEPSPIVAGDILTWRVGSADYIDGTRRVNGQDGGNIQCLGITRVVNIDL